MTSNKRALRTVAIAAVAVADAITKPSAKRSVRARRAVSAAYDAMEGQAIEASGNLPDWRGASAVYSFLYGVLEKLGAELWANHVRELRKKGRRTHNLKQGPTPTMEMQEIIAALSAGDEETLKAIALQYKGGGHLPSRMKANVQAPF